MNKLLITLLLVTSPTYADICNSKSLYLLAKDEIPQICKDGSDGCYTLHLNGNSYATLHLTITQMIRNNHAEGNKYMLEAIKRNNPYALMVWEKCY